MWIGEKITDKGLGNGTSIIIMIGILARFPNAVHQEFLAKSVMGSGGILIFVIEIAILVAVIMGLIVLIQGVRKVPVNYAKQIVGNRQFGGARQFLPLKVNSAGVMPIIFAQAIMFLPTLISYTSFENKEGISRIFSDPRDYVHMIFYGIIVIGFTFLYTSLIFNPKQVADDLKRNNGFVPGVKPGQPTADFIGSVMDKITLPGAVLTGPGGYSSGICTTCRSYSGICILLRRNFSPDHGCGYPGYTAADRNPAADASVRRADEVRPYTGPSVGYQCGDLG